MPYRADEDLPASIRHHLPAHARAIYREAFNHAWSSYKTETRREEIAHRVAWAAVKKLYRKVKDTWVPKSNAVG